MRVTFSTNAMSVANGTAEVSRATTAARYDFASSVRQSRSQAAEAELLVAAALAGGTSAAGSPPPQAAIDRVTKVRPNGPRALMRIPPTLGASFFAPTRRR